jgi:hypothetical protein
MVFKYAVHPQRRSASAKATALKPERDALHYLLGGGYGFQAFACAAREQI